MKTSASFENFTTGIPRAIVLLPIKPRHNESFIGITRTALRSDSIYGHCGIDQYMGVIVRI